MTTQPSRTLKILAQLRGESATDVLEGFDAEADPALAPYAAELDPEGDPALALSVPERGRVPRARPAAFRSFSPKRR